MAKHCGCCGKDLRLFDEEIHHCQLVEPAFRTLLIAAVGRTVLPPPGGWPFMGAQADFDNGNGSCQGRTSFDGGLLMKVAKPEPRCWNGGVLSRLHSHNTSFRWNVLMLMITEHRAFGADDVAGAPYTGERLRKLRFLMTDNMP